MNASRFLHCIAFLALLPFSPLRSAEAPGLRGTANPFLQPPSISIARISPNGSRVGFLALKDERHYVLALLEAGSGGPRPVVQLDGQSIVNFWWKTDDLLLMLIAPDEGGRAFASYDFKTGRFNALNTTDANLEFLSTLPDHPTDMLFSAHNTLSNQAATNDVVRLNVQNGRTTLVERDPGITSEWFISRDGSVAGGLELRRKKSEFTLFYREAPGRPLKPKVYKLTNDFIDFIPFGVAPDQKRLIALDFTNANAIRIVYFDPVTDATELIDESAGLVPQPIPWGIKNELAGLDYDFGTLAKKFFNPEAQAFHEALGKAFPGMHLEFQSFSRDGSRAVVLVESDRVSGQYVIADRATGSLTTLGPRYEPIGPSRTFVRRNFSLPAVNGLEVAGIVTLPAAIQRPPVIVYLHSDQRIYQHDNDQFVRYLASQGFAVAEINHRGKFGLTPAMRQAGLLQRDRAITDDILGAVQVLDREGLVDGGKVVLIARDDSALNMFAAAVRGGPVKAIVGIDPMVRIGTFDNFKVSDVESSLLSEDAITKLAGGWDAVQEYRKRIDPQDLVPRLTMPVLFISDVTRRSGRGSMPSAAAGAAARNQLEMADDLVRPLKRRLPPSDFIERDTIVQELGYRAPQDEIEWRIQARYVEKIVEFLRKAGI